MSTGRSKRGQGAESEVRVGVSVRRAFEAIVAVYGAEPNEKRMIDDAKKGLESTK